jgi:hypothetical protein
MEAQKFADVKEENNMNKHKIAFISTWIIIVICLMLTILFSSVSFSKERVVSYAEYTTDSGIMADLRISQATSVTSIIIHDKDGKIVGKISWLNGTISFEGNIDESAKMFFEYLIKMYILPYQYNIKEK